MKRKKSTGRLTTHRRHGQGARAGPLLVLDLRIPSPLSSYFRTRYFTHVRTLSRRFSGKGSVRDLAATLNRWRGSELLAPDREPRRRTGFGHVGGAGPGAATNQTPKAKRHGADNVKRRKKVLASEDVGHLTLLLSTSGSDHHRLARHHAALPASSRSCRSCLCPSRP